MSGIWLPASALTINLFLVIIFFTKKNTENKEVKIYCKLLITGLLFSLNALVVYIVSKTIGNNEIVALMQRIHLSLLDIVGYYFLAYCIEINSFKDTTYKTLTILNKVFIVFLIILIMILPIEVINYDEVLDVGGLSYYISISGVVVYFIFLIFFVIKYFLSKKENFKKCIPFLVLISLFCIGLLLRHYYPEIITETYCVAFALLSMFFTIENPDIRMLNEVEIAREKAEKANAAKTDFLSSMSHEIRTPLNAIVGFSEAILEEKTLEDAQNDAKDIIDASTSLLDIVNGILDISKLEANKVEIVNTEYNLKEECESLIKLIKPRIGEKPIELNLTVAPDVPETLYGDKSKIKEIMSNLLTHKIK